MLLNIFITIFSEISFFEKAIHFMDFFKKSLFWEDIHKLHLPVEGVQATEKKKKAQSSGLKVEGSTKEVARSQAPRLILQTWSLSLVLPPSLPDDHVLFVWPCAQCNLDSEMSEPEPLPPVTLFSRRGTSTQTDIILVRHSCNLQRILSYSVLVPKTILYSFQMQVLLYSFQMQPGSKELTLPLYSSVAFFLPEVFSSERRSLRRE